MMNLKAQVQALCRKQGITIKELEIRSGSKPGTIGHWDTSIPSVDKVIKVADYFGITIDELVTGEQLESSSPRGRDKELLDAYHKASPRDRDIIDNIISRYVAENKVIPLLCTAAAAGSGEPDTELGWEDHSVPASSPAEFAVRISGDSMEPVLRNGEIAMCIKRRPEIGDLAVIMINGSLVVKQYIRDNYGNVYLRSLNRARKDCDYDLMASGNDTAMYYGKILLSRKIPLVDE